MRLVALFVLITTRVLAAGSYAPAAGTPGSLAIHKDSSIIVAWAKACEVTRGYQDISNTSLGYVTAGNGGLVVGPSDPGLASLGDGGSAIVTFENYISNGEGPDFAVFENSFDGQFLELAHVEVSSDGVNYFRFPSHSETTIFNQVDTFGLLDPTELYNLAGKYQAQYGTPFDLEELANEPGLDITKVTHVRVIDVVGSLDPSFASYDSQGNRINDPFPTPFESGGFDLEAIAVINSSPNSVSPLPQVSFKVYPNPVQNEIHVECSEGVQLQIFNLHGALVKEAIIETSQSISVDFPKGYYQVVLKGKHEIYTTTIVKI